MEVKVTVNGVEAVIVRDGQDEALCYCGFPTGEFAKLHDKTVEFPDDQTFLVFLTQELKVTKYRFCEIEPETNGLPLGHETRFRRPLWLPE